MKRVFLLRHAKSGWDDPVARDFDRPLNVRGKLGAELMGQHFLRERIATDHVVASPALRVVETIEQLSEGLGSKVEPAWDRRMYLASGSALLELLQELPDATDHVIFVGHNPGLEDLALMLVPEDPDDKLRASIEGKLPTAALVEIVLNIDHWSDAREWTGRIASYVRPRDLNAALGPEH